MRIFIISAKPTFLVFFGQKLCQHQIHFGKISSCVRSSKQANIIVSEPKGIKQKNVYRGKNNARDFYVLDIEKICSVGVRYPFINRV